MRTRLPNRGRHRGAQPPGPKVGSPDDELRVAVERDARRVHRLRINVAAWAVGSVLMTTLWVANQWRANGWLSSFGHEGKDGQWNPTLWALGVGIWSLIVGIMALRVHFERPATATEVDVEAERMTREGGNRTEGAVVDAAVRLRAHRRLDSRRRVRFHIAAWVLGMIILTLLWALIEWQDNGDLERFSSDSRPGSWDPWILSVGGIWAAVIVLLRLWEHVGRHGRK